MSHSIAATQTQSGYAMLFIVPTGLGLAQNWRNYSTLRSGVFTWNIVFVSLTTAFKYSLDHRIVRLANVIIA